MTSTSGGKLAKITPEEAIRDAILQKTGAYSYYQGHDKGEVGESISGTTCCSVRFLARLLDDIQMLSALELKMLHLKTRTASPIPADNHVYQTIEAEVARLAAYPCLFPNDGFRRFFMRRAHDLSKAGKGLAMGWDRSRSLMAEASNKIHESQGNWLHKCRDPKRTSWQQFLHSSGPGSGLSLSTFPTDGCTRVFPHAGMELLRSWFEKNEDVEHQINQAGGFDERERPIIRNRNINEYFDNSKLRKILQGEVLPWPEIQSVGPHVPRRFNYVVDLEELSNDFCILDGRPEPHPVNPVPAMLINETNHEA